MTDKTRSELADECEKYAASSICPGTGARLLNRAATALRQPDLQEVVELRKALQWFVSRKRAIQAKFDLHGPKDTANAMKGAFLDAEEALAKGNSIHDTTK